ncbi:hypothetical protein BDV12DRAFT_203237 [Aspergillus spectabilis]
MPSWSIRALALAATGCFATQFVTEDSLPSSLSDRCLNVLAADVACVLEEVCTTQCLNALQLWQDDALSACDEDSDIVEMDESTPVPASFIPILFAYHLNKGCIRADEQWCHRFAYEMSEGNATSQNRCHACAIKQMQFVAEGPLYGGHAMQPSYTSLTSSCTETNFPLTPWTLPYSSPGSSATPTPSPGCKGTKYTIQPGDTCQSISQQQGVGTAWLLYDNGLSAFCADFPTEGDICIQNTCETHVLTAEDTCTSLSRQNLVSEVQLYTWNPILDINCRHISRSVRDTICLSPGTVSVALRAHPHRLQPLLPYQFEMGLSQAVNNTSPSLLPRLANHSWMNMTSRWLNFMLGIRLWDLNVRDFGMTIDTVSVARQQPCHPVPNQLKHRFQSGAIAGYQKYAAVIAPMTCQSVLTENGITMADITAGIRSWGRSVRDYGTITATVSVGLDLIKRQ